MILLRVRSALAIGSSGLAAEAAVAGRGSGGGLGLAGREGPPDRQRHHGGQPDGGLATETSLSSDLAHNALPS